MPAPQTCSSEHDSRLGDRTCLAESGAVRRTCTSTSDRCRRLSSARRIESVARGMAQRRSLRAQVSASTLIQAGWRSVVCQVQLAAAKDLATTEDAYLSIINAKTAALFSAAAEVGAAIAERPAQEQATLRSYGKSLGIAFQLIDDALDYSGDSADLGKDVGDDFREGKITLPVILAYRRGDDAERDFWQRTITRGEINDGDLEHAMQLMAKYQTVEATRERATYYGSVARDAVATFPDGTAKSAMLDVVEFCIGRAS